MKWFEDATVALNGDTPLLWELVELDAILLAGVKIKSYQDYRRGILSHFRRNLPDSLKFSLQLGYMARKVMESYLHVSTSIDFGILAGCERDEMQRKGLVYLYSEELTSIFF